MNTESMENGPAIKPLGTYVSESVAEKLTEAAKREHRSVSAYLRLLILRDLALID